MFALLALAGDLGCSGGPTLAGSMLRKQAEKNCKYSRWVQTFLLYRTLLHRYIISWNQWLFVHAPHTSCVFQDIHPVL